MKTDNKIDWTGCPIRYGMGIFGDKWSLLIMRDLMFKQKQNYNEFLASEEGISTNILADRLSKLEANGLIKKQQDPHNLAKKIYSLTQKGLDLMPVMLAIVDWSEKYDDKTMVPAEFIESYRNNKARFTQQLIKKLKN